MGIQVWRVILLDLVSMTLWKEWEQQEKDLSGMFQNQKEEFHRIQIKVWNHQLFQASLLDLVITTQIR